MFEYSFILPSGLTVLVHFLADRPELVPTVASACFSEWTKAIVNDFGILTEDAYMHSIREQKLNTSHAPFILVAHTAEVSGTIVYVQGQKLAEGRGLCRGPKCELIRGGNHTFIHNLIN